MSDSEEPSSFVPNDKIPFDDFGQESFMNVLSALILSEEFQGIVSSEAGNNKLDDDESSVSPVPSKAGVDSKSRAEDPGSEGISNSKVKSVKSDKVSIDDGGLALLWFGVITLYWCLLLSTIQHGRLKFLQPVTWCCMDQ